MIEYTSYCDLCGKKTVSKGDGYNEEYKQNSFRLDLDNFNFDSYDESKEPDWLKERKVGLRDVCFVCSAELAVGVREVIARLKR